MLPSFTYVPLTFHNVPFDRLHWFSSVIKFLHQTIGFVSPSDILNYKRNPFANSVIGPRLLLTFDDGFYSNKVIADTILDPLDIKAIFFPVTEFIDIPSFSCAEYAQKNFFPTRSINLADGDLRSMSSNDILCLVRNGHHIGCHTSSHPFLSQLSPEQQFINVNNSRKFLEDLLTDDVHFFAYPFGNISSIDYSVVKIVSSMFDFSFTNIRGNNLFSPSNHLLFRQNISPRYSLFRVLLTILGFFDYKYSKDRDSLALLLAS